MWQGNREIGDDYSAHLDVLPSDILTIVDTADGQWDLNQSYEYCMNLFKLHAKSFYFASRYFEDNDRKAFAALYGFCRLADDFADEIDLPREQIEKELNVLKDLANRMATGEQFQHPLFHAFGDTIVRYNIPVKYLHELIEGVRMDLNLMDVETIDEEAKYCYHVASTVGILMCHIWGAIETETLARAADLGHALQLTNILRDVAEDWDNGRIYIPKEIRERFRVTREDFENRRVTPNFRLMMKSEIARARTLYAQADVGLNDLPPAGAFTVKVAGRVYGEIMTEIEKMNYDPFKKRAVVPKWKKLWIAYKCRREYKQELKAYKELEKSRTK